MNGMVVLGIIFVILALLAFWRAQSSEPSMGYWKNLIGLLLLGIAAIAFHRGVWPPQVDAAPVAVKGAPLWQTCLIKQFDAATTAFNAQHGPATVLVELRKDGCESLRLQVNQTAQQNGYTSHHAFYVAKLDVVGNGLERALAESGVTSSGSCRVFLWNTKGFQEVCDANEIHLGPRCQMVVSFNRELYTP